MLDLGAPLPDLTVPDDSGASVSLARLGRPLVLYFYPKDDTPGCTNEATQFRDLFPRFTAAGATIVGVSRDSVASHAKFKAKHEIPFALLADTESTICDAFGTIVEKKMYGKTSMGLQRSTFLFGADGTLLRLWKRVSVDEHAEDVLAHLP